ncbi:glycosyltransferase family 2 protein [Aquimarina sp. 2-A2]|uniref:glycosyltransferase family 2 protein n=1 Tax=Aquimarina sp. 2-A2 TaxID=3382644 RepID=UPI00387EF8A7
MKTITIIIPMYNVSQYLHKCINSVVNQNVDNGSVEVIMVNDESPDDSLEVANSLAQKYNFIKIISQKNKGLGGARNTGIDNATGDYILFLDADDWLIENSLRDLISILTTEDLDILEFGANLVSEQGHVVGAVSKHSEGNITTGIDYYNNIKYSGSACNKLYNVDFLNRHELRFLEKIYGEDFEFNTRAFYYAKQVLAIEKICTEFLQTTNSITRNNDRSKKDKYLSDYIKILKNIKNFYDEIENPTQAIEAFFKERFTMININAFYMMFKHRYAFSEVLNYRDRLIAENVFYNDFPVAIKKKDFFRKLFLKNFALFRIAGAIRKVMSI